MPKLNVAVIGAGSIGNVHLTGYAADPKNVAIRAVSDVNPLRLAEMADKFGIPQERRYSDYKLMLAKEKLDAVSVCLPNVFHFEAAAAVLKKNVSLLIEKPMVLTVDETRKLKKIAAASKGKLMVAFSHRFMGQNIAAHKLLRKGAIGKPFMIRVRYAHSGPYPGWAQGQWFYNKKLSGGGALLDMGIHAIDMCQYLIGPVKSVAAEVRTLRKKIEVDDNAIMLLDFGGIDCLGYIECGWTSTAGFAGIEIYGDAGSIVLDVFGPPVMLQGITKPDGTVDVVKTEIPVKPGKSHWPLQMESWIRHLQGKKTETTIPGIEEGSSSLAVALAAMESSKTGKRVKL